MNNTTTLNEDDLKTIAMCNLSRAVEATIDIFRIMGAPRALRINCMTAALDELFALHLRLNKLEDENNATLN